MATIKKPITTWQDLFATLQQLNPERLAQPFYAGNEVGGSLEATLCITTEPHYELETNEPLVGEKQAIEEVGLEELVNCAREEAGSVYLVLGL